MASPRWLVALGLIFIALPGQAQLPQPMDPMSLLEGLGGQGHGVQNILQKIMMKFPGSSLDHDSTWAQLGMGDGMVPAGNAQVPVGGPQPVNGQIPVGGAPAGYGQLPAAGPNPVNGQIPVGGAQAGYGQLPAGGSQPAYGQLPAVGPQPAYGQLPGGGPQAVYGQPQVGGPQPGSGLLPGASPRQGNPQSPFSSPQLGNGPLSGGSSPAIPTPGQIMDFIRSKYQNLFPTPGVTPQPLDPSTLFPLPDLSNISKLVSKRGLFCGFSPAHLEALNDVKGVLSQANSTVQMLDIAQSLKQDQNIHPHLWFYALSHFVCRDPEMDAVHRVSPVDALPDLFIPAETLRAARGQRSRTKRQGQGCVVADENVGADNGIENRLWYFRESVGVNSHHWYYHIMYPFSAQTQEDRHGELFYYMHSSLLARYNAERLSNGLPRVQPINPFQRGTAIQGYNPHLSDDNAGVSWSLRPANQPLADIVHQNDPNLRTNVFVASQVLQARTRITQAINDGSVLNTQNQRVPINNIQGIAILGNIIQANQWSLNPNYYGSLSATGLHNNGHVIFAFMADPQYRSQIPPGVMGDPAPAMRDPIFFQWHETIQQLFNLHKSQLAPYAPLGGELPLGWTGVRVTGLSVLPTQSGTLNQVTTTWSQQTIRLTRGLDLSAMPNNMGIQICAKQLDHEEFTFQIAINNDNNAAVTGTVRIFLAPRFDEQGNRFDMTTQRTMFFVLDSFGVTLNPGANTVNRRSQDSALTIPWAQSLQELNTDPNTQTPYCGCGWPRNMLLPKGTPAGMVYDLFVMVTNRNDDSVGGQTAQQSCIAAPIYCGITGQRYPDAKPMGYPFDRFPYSVNQRVVANLDEYVANVPNMGTAQIQIRFVGQ